MKQRNIFLLTSLFILQICLFVSFSSCDSPTEVKDELEEYTKVNRLDTLRTFPDKFYFEVYLSVIQSPTDWESGPTLIFPDSSVWEYRAKTDIPGNNLLLILGGKEGVFNDKGNKDTSFIIGFTKNTQYHLAVNNTGSKKGTIYYLFTRTTKKYNEAQYQL
jgi:hypothetical protein